MIGWLVLGQSTKEGDVSVPGEVIKKDKQEELQVQRRVVGMIVISSDRMTWCLVAGWTVKVLMAMVKPEAEML